MADPSKSAVELRILAVLCILILCGILVAGLWPFHAPGNEVSWLTGEGGLRFGRHGTILSRGTFTTAGPADQASGAIEIWVRPDRTNSEHTLLAFSTPKHPLQFLVRRYQSGIVVHSVDLNQPVQNRPEEIYIADVFHKRQPVFLTLTSGIEGTSTYVNGALLNARPDFHFSSSNFAGQLVLGTSPVDNDSWSGQLRGLAIYNHDLTPDQVSRHFATWTTKGRPELGQNGQVLGLYLFDEHQGRIVHDRSGSGIDLQIPEQYMILREKFLEPLWEEFHPNWSYWKSVGINIGGFIPLGFFFCAYLTLAGPISRPALVTIILGATVSVTIEVLQAYLPTRDSGMTDIITNTLGTGLGVVLYRWQAPLLNKTLNRILLAALR